MSKYIRLRFLLPLALLVILVIFFLTRPTSLPNLTSTSPTDKSIGVALLPEITLRFADDLPDTPITLSSMPEVSYRPTTILARELGFTPSAPLSPNTTYRLSIQLGGSVLHQFSFTTKVTQTDQVVLDQIHLELKDKYPLAQKTPYSTPEYRVIYSAPLTLEITLKTSALTPAQAISQIQSWVKSQGLDPTTHQFLVK
ncbi:MAG: Ig-like domain-containing protein [bacterium]